MIRISIIVAPALLGGVMALGLAGCTHDRHDEIPGDAMVMSEGTGTISARAPHDGTVYVYDAISNKLIYKGKVDENQMVKVDPEAKKVMLDGTTASETDINGAHQHKIFFDSGDDVVIRRETKEYRRESY